MTTQTDGNPTPSAIDGATPQIDRWRSDLGHAYRDRNSVSEVGIEKLSRAWAQVLAPLGADQPESILEVGSNIGLQLRALRRITQAEFFAVEPNPESLRILVEDGVAPVENTREGMANAIPFDDGTADLAFTSGVLIHVPPEQLDAACHEIYRCSKRWIGCLEYFSDQPESKPYHGFSDMLFKRDFGGHWMDLYPDLRLVGNGFFWRRSTGLDNITWWLFEKR